MLEMESDKDKKEKDKDRVKEKELLKCNSWPELRKSGLTLDDVVRLRRRDNSERTKNRYSIHIYNNIKNQILEILHTHTYTYVSYFNYTCIYVNVLQNSTRLYTVFRTNVNVEQLSFETTSFDS